MKIDSFNNHGIVYEENMPVFSFEMLSAADQTEIEADKANFKNAFTYGETFTLDKYTIASYGSANNLPGELRNTIKANHLLPEILKKQVRFLYGTGPYLYKEVIEEKKTVKIPVSDQYPEVFTWLDSWEKKGLSKSFPDFAKLVIQEYYYTEGVFIKYLFNKSRRIAGNMPVRGLEYIPSTRARFAMSGKLNPTDPVEDEKFDHVLYGRWDYPYRFESVAFPRFDPSNPFKHPVCINYARDLGFGEEIYSFPTFYYGLKEWIKGSNLNPKYINSYLRNSLNAKLHVIIPATWIEGKKKAFQDACEINKTRKENEQALITEFEGVTIGTEYTYNLVQQLINRKFREITNILSGEGKNQGKIFTSVSHRTEHGLDEWEFKDIPTKYKEFVTSIL